MNSKLKFFVPLLGMIYVTKHIKEYSEFALGVSALYHAVVLAGIIGGVILLVSEVL